MNTEPLSINPRTSKAHECSSNNSNDSIVKISLECTYVCV